MSEREPMSAELSFDAEALRDAIPGLAGVQQLAHELGSGLDRLLLSIGEIIMPDTGDELSLNISQNYTQYVTAAKDFLRALYQGVGGETSNLVETGRIHEAGEGANTEVANWGRK
jgi:hypothetical protein